MEMTEEDKIVLRIAGYVADAAPQRQGKHVSAAQIPWSLIHDLRAALWNANEARRR